MKKKKLLFVLSIPQYDIEFFSVIKYLKKCNFEISVIIGWNGNDIHKVIKKYKNLNCNVFHIDKKFLYSTKINKTIIKHKNLNPKRISFIKSKSRLILFLKYFVYFYLLKRHCKIILDKFFPEIIVFGPYTSCGTFDNAIHTIAKKRNICSICLPMSAHSGKKSVTLARSENFRNGMLPALLSTSYDTINKLISKLFKNWVSQDKELKIFMHDPIRMLAAKYFDLLDDDPWQKPSDLFDHILVFNKFAKDMILETHSKNKVHEIGVPSLDISIENYYNKKRQKEILLSLDLEKKEKFILYNVEPGYEHKYMSKEDHWELFNKNMNIVSKFKCRVFLSLHPLCNKKDYIFVQKKYDVKIVSNYRIHDLYPFAHIIVSFPCSTNIFSNVFKRNLIIYDYLGLTKPESQRREEFRISNSKIVYDSNQLKNQIKYFLKTPKNDFKEKIVNSKKRVAKFLHGI